MIKTVPQKLQVNQDEMESYDDIVALIISDKMCRKILTCIRDIHLSACEISKRSCIPISTTYRRLQALHDARLVIVTGTISNDGKKSFLYKSNVQNVTITFDDIFRVQVS